MNHVSIFEKSWLELVFEGRNKQYGAYRLRLENQRTTLFALLAALALFSLAIIPALLHKSVALAGETVYHIDCRLHPLMPPQLPKPPKIAAANPTRADDPNKRQLKDPVVVHAAQATDVVITQGPVSKPNDIGDGGTSSSDPATGTSDGTAPEARQPENTGGDTGIATVGSLDRLPEFPGGIDNFYKYVGRNFRQPEIPDETQARVIVSFVIEKDGTLSDIRVARDPGYGMGEEAIRVLRSLRTKWEPGYIKGQPVRTAYTLPIIVQMK